MWFPVIINDKNYILKAFSDEFFNVYCSDLENIWVERLKTDDICNRFEELNGIEMPSMKLQTKILSFFYDNRNDTNFEVHYDNDAVLNLKIQTTFSYKDIRMDFKLQKESATFLSQNVVLPLCFSLILMKKREQQLMDIINDKDMELKEHTLSGHFIDNRKLVTPTFDEASFKSTTNNTIVDLFSNMKFVENLEKNCVDNSDSSETEEDVNTSNEALLTSKLKRRKKCKRGQRKRYRQL